MVKLLATDCGVLKKAVRASLPTLSVKVSVFPLKAGVATLVVLTVQFVPPLNPLSEVLVTLGEPATTRTVVALLSVTGPVPSEPGLLAMTSPLDAPMIVPPEYVPAPLIESTPGPVLVRLKAPPRAVRLTRPAPPPVLLATLSVPLPVRVELPLNVRLNGVFVASER